MRHATVSFWSLSACPDSLQLRGSFDFNLAKVSRSFVCSFHKHSARACYVPSLLCAGHWDMIVSQSRRPCPLAPAVPNYSCLLASALLGMPFPPPRCPSLRPFTEIQFNPQGSSGVLTRWGASTLLRTAIAPGSEGIQRLPT